MTLHFLSLERKVFGEPFSINKIVHNISKKGRTADSTKLRQSFAGKITLYKIRRESVARSSSSLGLDSPFGRNMGFGVTTRRGSSPRLRELVIRMCVSRVASVFSCALRRRERERGKKMEKEEDEREKGSRAKTDEGESRGERERRALIKTKRNKMIKRNEQCPMSSHSHTFFAVSSSSSNCKCYSLFRTWRRALSSNSVPENPILRPRANVPLEFRI